MSTEEKKSEKTHELAILELKRLFIKVSKNEIEEGLDEIISLALTNPDITESHDLNQMDNMRFNLREIQKTLLKIESMI